MHRLSPELLLNVFKRLDSKEMVNIVRVSKDWLKIIDENKSLWRRLVLPERQSRWNTSIVELFHRKSCSSLQEINMQINFFDSQIEEFSSLLKKSENTLHTLYLKGGTHAAIALSELCWRLPKLTKCIIVDSKKGHPSPVKFVKPRFPNADGQIQDGLRVLWTVTTSSIERAISEDPCRLDQLVSLKLQDRIECFRLEALLRQSSKTLKHLSCRLRSREPMPPTLNLPLLEILELQHDETSFPSWLRIPYPCTLIFREPRKLFRDLPPISKLWVRDLRKIRKLATECPNLIELRVDTFDFNVLKHEQRDSLILLLRERKEKVDAGTIFKGLTMTHLIRLVFPVRFLSQSQLSQLKDLVEEVVDLESVDRSFEVEV